MACAGSDSDDGSSDEATGFELIEPDVSDEEIGAKDTKVAPPDFGDEDVGKLEESCPPGDRKCGSKTVALVCNDEGTVYEPQPCKNGTACQEGQCKLITCTPNEPTGFCEKDQKGIVYAEYCNGSGTGFYPEYCDVTKPVCWEGTCQNLKCQPGSQQCKGFGAIEQCANDGSGYEVKELCGQGNVCKLAKCLTACKANLKENTYFGCEYWAVDLDSIEGAKFQNVAVVVSNTDTVVTASVTITNMADGVDLELPTSTVPPLSQVTFLLPKGYDLEGSMLNMNSFRIKASAPITVHQFNPLNADNVYSNDASLLLPSNVAGKEFLGMSWHQRQADMFTGNIPLRGFLTVIAVEKGTTKVTVKAPVDIEPGENVELLPAQVQRTYELQYGQVLNLESGGGLSGPDLTGTHIKADKRISVFGGHECANIPLIIQEGKFVGTKFCDHVEQQLFPLDTWGTKYVGDAFKARSPDQKDVWRVLSGADGVTLTTDPPQPVANGITLNKGGYVQFESAEDFVIFATGPISVGHYLKGSNFPGYLPLAKCSKGGTDDTGIGDPAFTLPVPIKQQRSSYIVLTPDNYVENFINVIYRTATSVDIDGQPVVLDEIPIGSTDWHVQRVPVEPGVHRVEGTLEIGVTAYGYDCDVSYAYPGGLNLVPKAEEID
jgi:hypothetical protein